MIGDKGTPRRNVGIAIACCVLVTVIALCGCATLKQERKNEDGSSYSATGTVFGRASIEKLQTTLHESIDEDGVYTLDIGQQSAMTRADIAELIELLTQLIALIPMLL